MTHLTTPSPSPSSPHTPLTIRSLKRQENSLEEITADLSPTIQRKLGKFVRGSLAQVQLGAQALENLAHTQAAQKARAMRQQGGRHTLQGRGHGGVLYAHEARNMVVDREQAEANRAAAVFK